VKAHGLIRSLLLVGKKLAVMIGIYHMSVFIRNARILTLRQEGGAAVPVRARRGGQMKDLGVVPRGDVLIIDDKIAAVGEDLACPAGAEKIDAEGRVLMPGFVDCHTHACWAGDRLDEWMRHLAGELPEAVRKGGGGLPATVRAVRAATRKQLAAGLRLRLDELLRGYGLTEGEELKMLHAIQRAAAEWAGTVQATALLGGALDGEAAAYTRLVVREMLPAIWHEFPGVTIDARCDETAWPVEACVRLFERARKHGLPVRVQTDRYSSTGMILEAIKLHARSVDDLSEASATDLRALAASETTAVLLPATNFHENRRAPRGQVLLSAGGLVALASNFNPASSPTHSMPFVIALAVRYSGFSLAEAIYASTVNAAAVLGFTDRGTIEVGRRADVLLLRHRDERDLAFQIGANPVEKVICGGQVIH